MSRDVFVSYAHDDAQVADAICQGLEQRAIDCWIAPRDIRVGDEWASSIVAAVDEARVLVLVFSANANDSRHVRREVELAVEAGCILAPVRIEPVVPTGSLRYYMTDAHWLDAVVPPFEAHLVAVVDSIEKLISEPGAPDEPRVKPVVSPRQSCARRPSAGARTIAWAAHRARGRAVEA